MSFEAATSIPAWIAVALQLTGYVVYVRQVLRSGVKPNTASWFIWAYSGALDAASYVAMSGDWVKWLLPVTCNFSCLATFIFLFRKGQFTKISPWEWVCVIIDMAAVFVWWHWHSAMWAHLVMQISVPVSFAPILRSVWRNPRAERPTAWMIWSADYAFGALAIVLRWERWQEIVFSLNNLICHAMIGVLCFRSHSLKPLEKV